MSDYYDRNRLIVTQGYNDNELCSHLAMKTTLYLAHPLLSNGYRDLRLSYQSGLASMYAKAKYTIINII